MAAPAVLVLVLAVLAQEAGELANSEAPPRWGVFRIARHARERVSRLRPDDIPGPCQSRNEWTRSGMIGPELVRFLRPRRERGASMNRVAIAAMQPAALCVTLLAHRVRTTVSRLSRDRHHPPMLAGGLHCQSVTVAAGRVRSIAFTRRVRATSRRNPRLSWDSEDRTGQMTAGRRDYRPITNSLIQSDAMSTRVTD